MEKSTEIKLVQSPVISHQLQQAGLKVTERLNELNIDNQIATIDTVQSLKKLRADLNKELLDYEAQRKFVKEGVNKPYNEFEDLYKIEISEKYKNAIDKLKDKIESVESKIKKEKQENIKLYYSELCQSENIDFIPFEKLEIEINLSTTEKAYKEKCNEYISKVKDDISLIKSTEFEAEIMAEYKKTLNVSQSVTSIKDRKERERAEFEKIKQVEKIRRISLCKSLSMIWVEMTSAFEYDANIYITRKQVEDLTKDEFQAKIIEIESLIKTKKESQIKPAEIQEKNANLDEAKVDELTKEVAKTQITEPLQAPKVEIKEEIVIASFEVSGTMNQLRALGQYMKSNNINYKNI